MYTVEVIEKARGKEAVLVRRNRRLVGAASMPFVQWMHANVPLSQLAPEQAALVAWFEKHQVH